MCYAQKGGEGGREGHRNIIWCFNLVYFTIKIYKRLQHKYEPVGQLFFLYIPLRNTELCSSVHPIDWVQYIRKYIQ